MHRQTHSLILQKVMMDIPLFFSLWFSLGTTPGVCTALVICILHKHRPAWMVCSVFSFFSSDQVGKHRGAHRFVSSEKSPSLSNSIQTFRQEGHLPPPHSQLRVRSPIQCFHLQACTRRRHPVSSIRSSLGQVRPVDVDKGPLSCIQKHEHPPHHPDPSAYVGTSLHT